MMYLVELDCRNKNGIVDLYLNVYNRISRQTLYAYIYFCTLSIIDGTKC